ncbi:hypothetical protein C8Q80DRAFT_436688 [Daedaleopsis nitida]|nr:hypothetical protein C8Q80DRAFT_436688 [Daedaleopsis nitida]
MRFKTPGQPSPSHALQLEKQNIFTLGRTAGLPSPDDHGFSPQALSVLLLNRYVSSCRAMRSRAHHDRIGRASCVNNSHRDHRSKQPVRSSHAIRGETQFRVGSSTACCISDYFESSPCADCHQSDPTMTDPQQNGPIIPGELTDRIVDFLYDDWPSLASCVMINSLSALSPRAEFHLSHTITIHVQQYDSNARGLSHFLRLFGPTTRLAHLVQSLHISGARDSLSLSPQHTRADVETSPSIPTLPPFADLRHLPHLRSLVLSDLHIGLPGRFIHFLCSMPALAELSCLSLRGPAHSSSYRTIPDRARSAPSARAALPARLRVLRVVGTDLCSGGSDMPHDCLAEILGLSDSPVSDDSLDSGSSSRTRLSLRSAEIHFPDARRCERWIRGICSKNCATLTELGVTIVNAVYTHSDGDEDWNRLFAGLAACTALHSLNVRYSPQPQLHNPDRPLPAPSQRANTFSSHWGT